MSDTEIPDAWVQAAAEGVKSLTIVSLDWLDTIARAALTSALPLIRAEDCECGHPKSDHDAKVTRNPDYPCRGCWCDGYRPQRDPAAVGQLAATLLEALKAQGDADRHDAPWVSDRSTLPGFVEVDGNVELAALADFLIDNGWRKA